MAVAVRNGIGACDDHNNVNDEDANNCRYRLKQPTQLGCLIHSDDYYAIVGRTVDSFDALRGLGQLSHASRQTDFETTTGSLFARACHCSQCVFCSDSKDGVRTACRLGGYYCC